jgi:hypothetical protein
MADQRADQRKDAIGGGGRDHQDDGIGRRADNTRKLRSLKWLSQK